MLSICNYKCQKRERGKLWRAHKRHERLARMRILLGRTGLIIAGPLSVALGMMSGLTTENAWAQSTSSSWEQHAQSVLDLLMLDTRRALDEHAARSTRSKAVVSQPERTQQSQGSKPAVDQIKLVKLYGHSERLTVVLNVNGHRKEYRPGATLPYGGGGRHREYRLLRIVDTCVVLRKGNGPTRTACYQPQSRDPHARTRNSARPAALSSLAAPLPMQGEP